MTDPTKLKSKDVKPTRLALLEAQGWKCAICKLPCDEEKAVLDHCHKGGHIRAVLHRSCNSLLGKSENNAPRYGMTLEQLIAFLHGAGDYIDMHRTNQTNLIHPTHFTPEEKMERRKAKVQREREQRKKEKAAAKLAAKAVKSS